MTALPNVPNALPPAPEAPLVRGHAHTAGFADEFGDRQLKFDHTTAVSLEILHIKPEFGDSPEFEAALRARVDEVRHLQHPSLATIHGVERREGEGLCLISRLTSGRRVSELVPKAHGAAFALELIRLITPALSVLHRAGDGIAHGALSPERIVATRDGRLVVVEYAFGSALQALELPRQRLNDLGLVVPANADPIRFDGRTDMAQLGFIALSLLLGRRLDAADYPEKIPALLDEFARSGSPVLSAKLRAWLERAMQISPRSFASAREGAAALGELPDEAEVRMADSMTTAPRSPAPVVSAASLARSHQAKTATSVSADRPHAHETVPMFATPQRLGGGLGLRSNWITAALAVLAGVEGVAIAALLYTRPSVTAASTAAPAAQTAEATPVVPTPAVVPPSQPPNTSPASRTADATPPKTEVVPPAPVIAAPPVAAAPRPGGINVSSPIELQVFQDGKLVGSTAGPIEIAPGSHALEFVNETFGFRTRQAVNVRAGQVAPVTIAVPNGRISINAVPWAEVTIDGNAAGETPIANFSLPIGTHEIVFRHPQLGERKQTVVVKVDELVRVTQTFQPGLRY